MTHSHLSKVILGSASPRRREILQSLFSNFEIRKSNSEPNPIKEESASDYAIRSARSKGEDLSFSLQEQELLLCFDTVVSFQSEILGKPANERENRQMLQMLSGKTHQVMTAYYLAFLDQQVCNFVTTQVRFADLDENCIEWYVSTADGLDKAGGYGIQSQGRFLVQEIQGCYYNVVGLPVQAIFAELCRLGFTQTKGS